MALLLNSSKHVKGEYQFKLCQTAKETGLFPNTLYKASTNLILKVDETQQKKSIDQYP